MNLSKLKIHKALTYTAVTSSSTQAETESIGFHVEHEVGVINPFRVFRKFPQTVHVTLIA